MMGQDDISENTPNVSTGDKPVLDQFVFGAESTQRDPMNFNEIMAVQQMEHAQVKPLDSANRLPEDHNYSRSRALEKLQIQFPFLPISPLGNSITTIILSGSTVMVPIPAHAKMMKIACGSSENVYMALGRANPPSVDTYETGAARIDSREWIFCEGLASISLYSSSATATIRFFSQL